MVSNTANSSTKKQFNFGAQHLNNELFLIKFVMYFCFGLSLILSLIFWWSVGSRLVESILFVMFALVFELCKFISLPMAIKNIRHRGLISLNVTVYILLTVLSVLSSIGGIGSCLTNNQQRTIQSSSEYKTLTQQIAAEQTLIDTELATIQANLAHNYRTQAQQLQSNIPQQQAALDQLRQQRKHINATALPPSLTLLKMFSENFSISFSNLQNLFVMMIAILIELISTYLIIISMTGYKKSNEEYSPATKIFPEISETHQEASINKPCDDFQQEPISAVNRTSETPENISGYPKNFFEKYEKVRENIKNNIYKRNVTITTLMQKEKIGYKLAKLMLTKINSENNQQAGELLCSKLKS